MRGFEIDFEELLDLEDSRDRAEHAQALELAIAQTDAYIRVEQMEEQPDLEWLRRANSFLYKGRAALQVIDRRMRAERHQADLDLQRSRLESAEADLKQQIKDLINERRGLRKELKTARHEAFVLSSKLNSKVMRMERLERGFDRERYKLKAVRETLGLEAYVKMVEGVRA